MILIDDLVNQVDSFEPDAPKAGPPPLASWCLYQFALERAVFLFFFNITYNSIMNSIGDAYSSCGTVAAVTTT